MIKLDIINEVVTKTGITKTKAELARTDFVRTDGKQQFWADPKARETMIADVRKVFQEGGRENQPVQVSLMQTMVPLISTEGGKSQFAYDFQMTNLTKYKAEGLIVLETDAANPTPNDWRVSRVEMIRALSPPNTSMPGPGGMGPPGKPGGGPPGGGPPPRQQ